MTDKELMNIIKQSQICPNDNIMKMAFSYWKMTVNTKIKLFRIMMKEKISKIITRLNL